MLVPHVRTPHTFLTFSPICVCVCAYEGVTGVAARSNRGECIIVPHEIQILSPCLHALPPPDQLRDPVRFHRDAVSLVALPLTLDSCICVVSRIFDGASAT